MPKEIMYDINSFSIVTILLVVILFTYEVCYRIGVRYNKNIDSELKNQTNTIQAGTLGLLALLLGFTFNMALQRFDNRSYAVIKEANAIGTAMLRTKLLPKPFDSKADSLFQKYIDVRIKISTVNITDEAERIALRAETSRLQNLIWETAIKAAEIDPRPVTTGYFIISMNEVIDMQGERSAILQMHVPEIILFLLFFVLIINGALMGYSSGLGVRRAYTPTVLITVLIVMVVFIIIDLDRPKRGLIKVKLNSLLELKSNK